ncbi:phasin family protein [uncultured Cohaesibacter sp.]|uniref:phasin family protein n=1 Tax=uncultured Cohaesibacter sp. TaxID=1002546 RepID=UPI002930861F|nr:phasin family protein [uncultured Cohaesibacter sp.]
MTETAEKFEIPSQFREFAEMGIEQARKISQDFILAMSDTAETAEKKASNLRANSLEVNRQAFDYMEESAKASFELADALINTRDLRTAFGLQTDYMQARMQRLGEVALQMNETMTATNRD